MLSATRRAASARSACCGGGLLLEHLHRLQWLVLASNRIPQPKPLSTSAALHAAPQQRLSKSKREERFDKLVRKRDIRAVRKQREAQREEASRLALSRRRDDLQVKQAVAEEIAETLPPLSEEQLESMYQGLMSAPASDFALPALEASKAPALADSRAVDAQQRLDRLARLTHRLEDLEREGDTEVIATNVPTESLATRLRQRRDVSNSDSPLQRTEDPVAMAPLSSSARALIDHLGTLLPPSARSEPPTADLAGLDGPLPRGLLARSEWNDLVLACAEDGDTEGVIKGLELMERTTPIAEGTVLEQALAIYASHARPQDALSLANFARKRSLPLSVTAHHYLLQSILPSHPELAVRHLHSMEAAGHTPLLATYTAVAHRLLSPASPPNLVRQGWDLFSHARLVAYPVPDVPLFATMIQACSHGSHPSPERAIDLFTEMADDKRLPPSELAYNGVIRACAREGSQEYYHEALRFMRRMLDEQVAPSRHTFHALLEGAKRHGDLARARWMLVKMVGVGGEAAPNETTLALVLQTYAAFRPAGSRARVETKTEQAGTTAAVEKIKQDGRGPQARGEEVRRPAAELSAADDPAALPLSPNGASAEQASTLKVIEMLGQASLFYPGPLPQTSAEVAREARNLMLQVVGEAALTSSATDVDPPRDAAGGSADGMFPGVSPSTFLLNAYLAVLNSHASFASSLDFFHTAFARTGVEKNRYSYEIVLRRCEIGDVDDVRAAQAKAIWQEWVQWSEAPAPHSAEDPDLSTLEADEQDVWREQRRGREEAWARERRGGKHVAKMWGGLIRVLAKAYKEDEALAVLQRFVQTYPPNALRAPIPARTVDTAAPSGASPPLALAFPSVPVRLSSPLYPETSPSLDPLRAPYLSFADLAILHKRLADIEDNAGLAFVKWAVKSYEGSIRMARQKERREEGKR